MTADHSGGLGTLDAHTPCAAKDKPRPSTALPERRPIGNARPNPVRFAHPLHVRLSAPQLPERCPSGRRSSTGNAVWGLNPIEGSNPSLSVSISIPLTT